MADNVITIELQAIIAVFQAGFRQAQNDVNAFTNEVTGKFQRIEAAGAALNSAFLGFGALLAGGGILEGLKAIDEQVSRVKTSIDEAANSMRNMGGALDVDQIKAFINDLSQSSAAGVASLTDLYNAVQSLGAHVTDTAQLERAMTDAVQLSAARHIDFATAVSMVGRVLSGHLTMLVRAGIVTADEAKKVHTVEQAMELLEKKTKGATDKLDEHTVGWGKVGNAWQQATLDLGTALGPAIGGLINLLDDVVKGVDLLGKEWAVAWEQMKIAFYDFSMAIGGVLKYSLAPALLGVGKMIEGAFKHNLALIKEGFDQMRSAASASDIMAAWGVDEATRQTRAAIAGGIGAPTKKPGSGGAPGDIQFEGDIGRGTGTGKTHDPAGTFSETIKGFDVDKWMASYVKHHNVTGRDPYATDYIAENETQQGFVKGQIEDNRYQRQSAQISGNLTPGKSAELDKAAAELAKELAFLQLQAAEYKVQQAELSHNDTQLNTATRELAAAQDADIKATNDLALATQRAAQAHVMFGKHMADSIPVVNEFKNAIQQGATPLQAIFSILAQRSEGVRLALEMVANIVTVFARILDAVLVPIMMVLNRVLTAVVNILIDFWNAIASVLNLLGIHVDYLKNINSLFGNLGTSIRPLLDIVHDLPTLKEYGAGKWGPLQPDQYGAGGMLGGMLEQQNTTQHGILQTLIGILGLDWLSHSKWFADMMHFFSNTWANLEKWWSDLSQKSQKEIEGVAMIGVGTALLNTHATGIIGTLEKIFGVLMLVKGILEIIQALTGASAASSTAGTIGGILGLFGFGPAVAVPNLGVPGFRITPAAPFEAASRAITAPIENMNTILGRLASSVKTAPAGFRGNGGGSGPTDNSTSVTQHLQIGEVNEASDIDDIRQRLAFDADRFSRGRAYLSGYNPYG